jgi:hypothetical protein
LSLGSASIASAICSGETSMVRDRRAISASKLVVNGSSSVAVREIRGAPGALGGSLAGTAARSTAGILVTDNFCGTSFDDALGLRANGLWAGLAGAGADL